MAKDNKKNAIRFSLRSKIFGLVFTAFCFLIVATAWQIGRQADKVSAKSIERSLNQSSVILNTKIESRFASITEVAQGLAKDGRVLPLVFDGESLTLQDLSLEFQRALEFDILFFTDAEGTILARSDRPQAIGGNLAGKSALFDAALNGEIATGIFVSQGKLLQIVVAPIFDNVASDLVRGSLALAYELSDEIGHEIRALTESQVSFFVFTRNSERKVDGAQATFSTSSDLEGGLNDYFAHHKSAWQSLFEADTSFSEKQIDIDDELYYSVIQVFKNKDANPLGFAMVLRSKTELVRPYLEIQRRVLVLGLICLVIASLFAWVFALRISKPIYSIVDITENIEAGVYPSKAEHSARKDEIGMLHNAVVSMGSALKEKSELENYLSVLSEELAAEDDIRIPVAKFGEAISSDDAHADPTLLKNIGNLESEQAQDDDSTMLMGVEAQIDNALEPTEIIVDRRYRLLKSIGSGSMGSVYLAHDMDLDERVAVKMMNQEIFNKQESVNFKEEIRLARQITHRNILRIFDFGVWRNYYYITMEYVSGYDLGQLLRTKGALDVSIGVVMARQICSAMYAAHEQGIIHRDLKPSNMMITRQGVLKIMDFGLAMRVSKSEKPKKSVASSNSGTTVAGTPRYMAPEQFFNWDLDERTDIYAIGIILYALFTGTPPFSDKDYETLAKMHLENPVPQINLASGVFPEELMNIIVRALEKKPEGRYQSVRDILDDLAAL